MKGRPEDRVRRHSHRPVATPLTTRPGTTTFLGRIIVDRPSQQVRASLTTVSPTSSSQSRCCRCTRSGPIYDRSYTAKICATAAGSNAFAARQ